MKILNFQAENLKRLTVVDITPEGNLVQIAGKNGQGKSSVLDAIWMALEWSEASQGEPIRKGADHARIRLDLGELVVTRTFNRKDHADLLALAGEKTFTTSIKVEGKGGMRAAQPQRMLDTLFGRLSFDPLAFSSAKPDEQARMVETLVAGFDFDGMRAQNANDYELRAAANRQAKQQRSHAEGIVIPENAPPDRVDEDALAKQLEDAGKIAAEIERTKAARRALEVSRDRCLADAVRGRQLIEELRDKIADLEAQATKNEKVAGANDAMLQTDRLFSELPDTASIREALTRARMQNRWIEAREQKARLIASAQKCEDEASALTKAMIDRDAAMVDAVRKSGLTDGLAIDAKGAVTLNGLPFDQASMAERLRASLAVAMAANPTLKVIRITNGNDLDEDGLRLVAEMAATRDYQVWIERIVAGEGSAFVLEDGHLKGVPDAT